MNKFAAMLFAALLFGATVPVHAEDSTATLRVDRGTVMVSNGGEFVSTNSGAVVATGQRLMVAENSAATVVYGNGCNRSYTDPGVYVIEPECRRGAGILIGTALVGGAIIAALCNDGDDTPPLPVSR